jgi:hypothetical protein
VSPVSGVTISVTLRPPNPFNALAEGSVSHFLGGIKRATDFDPDLARKGSHVLLAFGTILPSARASTSRQDTNICIFELMMSSTGLAGSGVIAGIRAKSLLDSFAGLPAGLASAKLYFSGGRTVLDRVSESLLNEFSTEHGIALLSEDRRFEHFAAFITVSRHYTETFDAQDVLVGQAAGIDAIAIIVNGVLVTDIESLEELKVAPELDVTFAFVQADRGPQFEAAKMGDFGFAVLDFFKEQPQLPRNQEITSAAAIMSALYEYSAKFKRGNPACRLYFVTTGTWAEDQQLEARRRGIIADLNSTNMFRDVTFVPLGALGIQKLYRQSKSAIEREFVFENRVTVPEMSQVTQAYVGFLPVPELIKILGIPGSQWVAGIRSRPPQ